jgi:hypothetical protein
MAYSRALKEFIDANRPAEISLDTEMMHDRFRNLGGEIIRRGEEVRDEVKAIAERSLTTHFIIFYGKEKGKMPYDFIQVDKYSISYDISFEDKKIIFTPRILQIPIGSGSTNYGGNNGYKRALDSMIDLIPPIVEIEMPDLIIKLSLWSNDLTRRYAEEEENYDFLSEVTCFKYEAEQIKKLYNEIIQKFVIVF